MARVNAAQVATWVVQVGFAGVDRATVTAVGIASGADPNAPAGVFGVGGPKSDGHGQAVAAKAAVDSSGLDALPAHRTGAFIFYLPAATVAVAAVNTRTVVDTLPNPVTGATAAAKTVTDAITKPLQLVAYLGTPEAQNRATKWIIGAGLIVVAGFVFASSGARRATGNLLDKAGDVGSTVIAFRAAQGAQGGNGGIRWFGGRNSTSSGTAVDEGRPAEPKPPARQSEDEPTRELNPASSQASGILGRYQAQSSGAAPFRGRAARPTTPLPNQGEPSKRRRS